MEPAKSTSKTQTASAPVVTVSERAAKEIQGVLTQETEQFVGVRLQAMGGGCCGPQYGLALAKGPEEGDVVVESSGVKVFVNPQDQALLQGVKLDFVETPMGSGFHIENPNAPKEEGHGGHGHGHGGGGGCGCGGGGHGGHGHGSGGGCGCGSGGCGC